MAEFIISLGLGVALSFGVVLLAMILRAAIRSSRGRTQSTLVDPAQRLQAPPPFDDCDLARAVHGYDTPELCRDDTMARHQRVHERSVN